MQSIDEISIGILVYQMNRKRKWSSWLFIRYASSVKGKDGGEALLNTNEFVNKHYTDLYKHDELMWKLMCLTGTAKKS